MGKYEKLLKNSGIFLLANFGTKIVTFLLVRFYTEVLSPAEYGTIDLLFTTINLAIPLITLCITEAVLRFSIEDIDKRKHILTAGYLISIIGNFVFILSAFFLCNISSFQNYLPLFYLLAVTNSLQIVSQHFSRGIGQVKLFAFSGLIHTILQVGFNLLFLLVFEWGIEGYLWASVLANTITIFMVFVCGKLWQYIGFNFEKGYTKRMLKYSCPLIPNSLFWWIMQSSDRYVIVWMISEAANGLYSAAHKIPTIISTISSIFFQAWQLSSVEEANSEEKSKFYSNVFSTVSMILIGATSFIMLVLQPLYGIFVEQSYYEGWQCVPFLLMSTVFSCYASFLGTNYVAMRKTKGVFLTTVIGAILNIILNIILTPIMGIKGTAIATAIAFLVTWLARAYDTRKFVKIKYGFRTCILPLLLVSTQATLLTFGVNSIFYQIIFFVVLVLLFAKEVIYGLKKGMKYVKNFVCGKK